MLDRFNLKLSRNSGDETENEKKVISRINFSIAPKKVKIKFKKRSNELESIWNQVNIKKNISMNHILWLIKMIILEMENRSSENQQNLNFADLMVGPEVEFRMYRAQIKAWVIDINHLCRQRASDIRN